MIEVLLESALRSALIAAAAAVAMACLRVRAAAVRHCVWTVVLLAMLLLPVWLAWGPEVSFRVLPAAPTPGAPVAIGTSRPDARAMESADARPAQRRTAAGSPLSGVAAAPVAPGLWSWRHSLLALYATGAAVLLLRLLVGAARLRALVRSASLRRGYLTSSRLATPVTVGAWRPIVLLPEGWESWPEPRLATVLEHERAHARRRDPLVQWLALVNRAVFWFNPLAWWLERRLRALAEEACDAIVLERGHERIAYSECLLELARRARGMRRLPAGAHMAAPGCALPERIGKILGSGLETASRARIVGGGAICAALSAALTTVTLAQQAAPPEAAEASAPSDYWLDEWYLEVWPIMTTQEADTYQALPSPEQRRSFIEQFWAARDPTPGTPANEWRAEYESRVAYAESQWGGAAVFGYQTTRGLLYVVLGPPDSVEMRDEAGLPHEYWHYGPLAALGEDLTFRISIPQNERAGGCAYEILAPAPSETFEGDVAFRDDPPRRMAVHTYPRGFTTLEVPFDLASATRTSLMLVDRDVEDVVPTDLEVRAGEGVKLALAFSHQNESTARPPNPFFGPDGFLCTQLMQAGRYRLTAEVTTASGERLLDSVEFEVAGPQFASGASDQPTP